MLTLLVGVVTAMSIWPREGKVGFSTLHRVNPTREPGCVDLHCTSRTQKLSRYLGSTLLPPFNQGISTLHFGLIDPSKNGQSQATAARILRRRSQRGFLGTLPNRLTCQNRIFKPCNLPECVNGNPEIVK